MALKNISKKQENLFHLFIQNTDSLPAEAALFPYFEFMDQSIRKKFHQLKKIQHKNQKFLSCFQDLWSDLDNDDKVTMYVTWAKLLNKALLLSQTPKLPLQPGSTTLQDKIYIKKTALFQKWQRKNVKLTPTQFIILSSSHKNKEYDLKDYQIRKSRSRQNFAWLLQPINNNGKYLQCGVSSQTMFDQWFQSLKININNQRIVYFANTIVFQRENPGRIRQIAAKAIMKAKVDNQNFKTLTEKMIDREMSIDDDYFQNPSDAEEKHQTQLLKEVPEEKIETHKQQDEKMQQKIQQPPPATNPNIFQKLIRSSPPLLLTFTDTPTSCPLLVSQAHHRIYQTHSSPNQETTTLKYFTILPYPGYQIFHSITSQMNNWNTQIDTLTIKTKISSQNTILFYQKNKAQGMLYRERDFLYLRHCFNVFEMKHRNYFVVDKSIDSIHHPPFMTVVRAEKQVLWAVVERDGGKECLLVVEGWVKGGGYMNIVQNRELTLKFMKNLANLHGYLKQVSYMERDRSTMLFKENWAVDITKEDELETQCERKSSALSEQKTEIQEAQIQKKQQQEQLAEFIKKTTQQLESLSQKPQLPPTPQETQPQTYIPPPFLPSNYISIPQQYLNRQHERSTKQKQLKPKYFPHFRGHHLWKGQWEIVNTGGLMYIDEEKMKQQRKVLTFIIKKIGSNIFSGRGILNISLPVDIFCLQSNIQRIAMSFGFFPHYLEKAALIAQPEIQLKYLVSSVHAGSLIYVTMEKPFNPILGQTYQCWIDGCPVYFEQISHHPPIAAFLMKGRGYTVSGCVQAKMELSINSGTGLNQGVFKVEFENGNTFYYNTAAGCLSGLTYGDRKLNLVGKSFYWTEKGLFLELNYNIAAKSKGFFGGAVKGQGDEKLSDYFEGEVKQYPPQAVTEICFKKAQNKQIAIIPKGAPICEANKTFYRVQGRWNKYVTCGGEKMFDIDENRYYVVEEEKYPLASDSKYRQDIVYRRMKNFVLSQDFKQKLEVKQREDRKLRDKYNKSKH